MTCGRRRFDAANGCDSVRRRISARLAVRSAGGAASASLAAMAHNAAAGVRHCAASQPNGHPGQRYPISGCCMPALAASLRRGGSDGRTSATTQIVKTLHSCLDATRLYRCCECAIARGSRLSRFRPATDSSHFLRSRCRLAIIPAAGLTSRCKVHHHGSTGAPRARWARPELGNHAMMTPD